MTVGFLGGEATFTQSLQTTNLLLVLKLIPPYGLHWFPISQMQTYRQMV